MYADLEEARARRAQRASRTPELELEKGSSRRDERAENKSRDSDLAEQLRRRAQASRHSNADNHRDRPQRDSKSPSPVPRDATTSRRPRSPSSSPSRNRSRSRDSVISKRSHQSRRSSARVLDDRAEERRKRRRGQDDDEEGGASRSSIRIRGAATAVDDEEGEEEERARERRRRRSDRGQDSDRDRERERERERDRNRDSRRKERYNSPPSRADRDRYSSYYDDRSRDRNERERDRDRDLDRYDRSYDRQHRRRNSRYDVDADRRGPRGQSRYDSPAPSAQSRRTPTPEVDDYEERSVFCTQLSARLGQRDLGEFFEEHLGDGAVRDVRIVMDRITRRSKGVGYVEFAAKELVPKAIELTGKVLFGIPIIVQLTDNARARAQQQGRGIMDPLRPNMVPHHHPAMGPAPIDPSVLANAPLPMQYHTAGAPIHLNVAPPPRPPRQTPTMPPNAEARLYVGSLHFSLTDENVKAVFEPFGEIEYVDLHREPGTGKSKGFCFIQFKNADGAKKALESMNGFELAGRAIRVGKVNAKGSGGGGGGASGNHGGAMGHSMSHGGGGQGGGHLPQLTSSFDDGGGGGLNPERRAALMEKLARSDTTPVTTSTDTTPPAEAPAASVVGVTASATEAITTSLLLKNMFDPAEETEPNWDKDLAEDVQDECQAKYGPVTAIHVEKESAGEIYVTFANVDASRRALDGLNGRYFGGKPISAQL
ncbi:splicing factor, CC1-like protein [Testicularia cyperi]|uniref:Splicing factor, CC1-like protein n=1 Tax=Testicularia cyperi TaxID=1882483 RepID=A0A317XYK1_9BASI|nr:splicing factor, CC1-like protein [Testicularia cyperi]